MPNQPITLIPSHADLLLADVYHKMRDDPVTRALLQAFGAAFQIFEEIVFDIIVSTGLNFATGVELEHWGDFVGEPKGGLDDDDDYRRIIIGRVKARGCDGDIPTMLEIFAGITNAFEGEVNAWDAYPMGLILQTERESPMSDVYRSRVRAVMADAKAGGVTLLLIESIVGASIVYDDEPGYDLGEYSELI